MYEYGCEVCLFTSIVPITAQHHYHRRRKITDTTGPEATSESVQNKNVIGLNSRFLDSGSDLLILVCVIVIGDVEN